ncbi:MAG TPA: chemotaxis protein CheW [Acidobacteriota bacterium]
MAGSTQHDKNLNHKDHQEQQEKETPSIDRRLELLQRLREVDTQPEQTEQQIEQPAEELELLIFQLGQERYGLDIHQVAEIIRYQEPTQVPHTVDFLEGIISLRGRMVPVVNARKRLGHPLKAPDKKTRVIIVHDNSELQGILVDAANQVVRIRKDAVEPTPPVIIGPAAEFIEGVCEYKKQLVILLNLRRFLEFV